MILFITRKYPPSVGGMEKLSYEMTQAVGRIVPTRVIAWRGPRWGWPLFAAWAFFAGLWACLTLPVRFIHVSDPVIAPLGLVLARLTGRRWGLNVHGLDILYSNPLYQATVIPCIRCADAVIAISCAAREACLFKGIAPDRCSVIPVGLNIPPEEADPLHASGRLRTARGFETAHHSVLLTVGRLIPRKGVDWFVREVVPALAKARPDVLYLIAGEGPARPDIRQSIRHSRLQDRVALLSRVSDQTLLDLYATTTLFVMPNVPVQGDLEGFGVVAIEAASRGIPVLASRLEGIQDAIVDGENGILLPPGDASAWVAAICGLLSDEEARMRLGARAREFTQAHYNWEQFARDYVRAFGVEIGDRAGWDEAYLRVRRGARRRLNRLRAFNIPRDALILDYGCGDGINTRLLAQLGCKRVVSMDNSLRLLLAGRPQYPVAADGYRTPFADGAFDIVLVDGVLHHLDADIALREIARILRLGGKLCIVEPAASGFRKALDWVTFSSLGLLWSELRYRRMSLAEEWDTYQKWLQVERDLPGMAERAGFDLASARRTTLNQMITATRREFVNPY